MTIKVGADPRTRLVALLMRLAPDLAAQRLWTAQADPRAVSSQA